QGMAHNLIPQEFSVLFLEAETVILPLFVPLLEFDNQVNRLRILHALDTEQRLDIDYADAAQLDKVARNIRRGSHQRNIADFADLHHVIADQTVSSLDQLQSSLTLSDTALAHYQY